MYVNVEFGFVCVFLHGHGLKFQIRTTHNVFLHSEAIRVLFLVLPPSLELLPML